MTTMMTTTTAIIWTKYCQYDIKHYIINHDNNENRQWIIRNFLMMRFNCDAFLPDFCTRNYQTSPIISSHNSLFCIPCKFEIILLSLILSSKTADIWAIFVSTTKDKLKMKINMQISSDYKIHGQHRYFITKVPV